MLRFCIVSFLPFVVLGGKSDDLIESFGSVGGGHVPEYSAGACRAELVVVADQPDARAPIAAPGDDMVEREVPAMPTASASGLGARSRRATW